MTECKLSEMYVWTGYEIVKWVVLNNHRKCFALWSLFNANALKSAASYNEVPVGSSWFGSALFDNEVVNISKNIK